MTERSEGQMTQSDATKWPSGHPATPRVPQ
jgi:hypothetical protein